ncbi:Las1-like-domain-containing protein [Kickxella alabastrina]|uniref:Las1-like-domain-containing protein n=1 Tax=Kickxella alabastrina TaxID=61397 RepID=UPI00221FE439|nr:Las1-like-domain-containing protein [Kickxella alabastrina]KAI7833825.1 Las1-like-domain-containing protein [Kickxella alabastrina]
MSKIPKIVPWTSTEEYMSVAECLYSTDTSERKCGVAIVKAWRARARVPVAIDATANLVEMTIAGQEQRQGLTINQLRHLYTMALIRFVNTIVDLEQKGTYAQSIVSLAGRIGMPAWFVELRHAGTHEQLPSLVVLQSACDQALYWLKDYYWNKQTRSLPTDTQLHIREAISKYVAAQGNVPSKSEGRKVNKKLVVAGQKALEAATDELTQLVGNLHSDAVRHYLVPVLLEPGFLVPENKKMQSSFPDCKLPSALEAQWKELLQWFAECWGESLFVEELLNGMVSLLTPDSSELGIFELGDSSITRNHAATLIAWIRWILEVYYAPSNSDARSLLSLMICSKHACATPDTTRGPSSRSFRTLTPRSSRTSNPFWHEGRRGVDGAAAEGTLFTYRRQRQNDKLEADSSMDVDPVNGLPCQYSVSDGAVDVTAATAGAAAAHSRWSYVPQSSCIPPLDWPTWVDDIPMQIVPA